MNTVRIACATRDGRHFIKDHFGDADYFLIYEIHLPSGEICLVDRFKNPAFDEEKHGSERKAKMMAQLMKEHEIDAVANQAMGSNIQRMRKRFVPILSQYTEIEEALRNLDLNCLAQEVQRKSGEDRKILKVKIKRDVP